jgi:hypothetical protein
MRDTPSAGRKNTPHRPNPTDDHVET